MFPLSYFVSYAPLIICFFKTFLGAIYSGISSCNCIGIYIRSGQDVAHKNDRYPFFTIRVIPLEFIYFYLLYLYNVYRG